MPATLRCPGPSSRSLGHLSPHGTSARLRTASCAARPARSGQPAQPRRGDALGPHQHAHGEPGPGRRDPAPREPPAPGLLVLGDEHGAVGGARGGRGEQVGVRGAGAFHEVDARPEADQRGADGVVVERPGDPVHAADATAVPVMLRSSTAGDSDQWARSVADRRDGDRVHAVTGRFRLRGMTAAEVSSEGEHRDRISTPPRASSPTCTGATRPWRPTRHGGRAPARQGPPHRPRASGDAARPRLVRRARRPHPAPLHQLRHGGSAARSATAWSPAPARSTAGRSPCSARTPRCSAARSARCTARRSSR